MIFLFDSTVTYSMHNTLNTTSERSWNFDYKACWLPGYCFYSLAFMMVSYTHNLVPFLLINLKGCSFISTELETDRTWTESFLFLPPSKLLCSWALERNCLTDWLTVWPDGLQAWELIEKASDFYPRRKPRSMNGCHNSASHPTFFQATSHLAFVNHSVCSRTIVHRI